MSDNRNAYLKAMGIDVWLERTPTLVTESVSVSETVTVIEPAPVAESTSKPEQNNAIESLDWQALRSTVAECQKCSLANTRSNIVFGAGKETASLMILGDAPKKKDEQQGEPFSGEVGKLLTAMLKAMGYQRKDVYISNIVKCPIVENENFSSEAAAACEPYLLREINLLQPDLILVLGSAAAQQLLKSKSTLGRLRGQLHYIEGVNIPVIVSFDPSYLLQSPNEKRKAWEDLKLAMKELSAINVNK